MRRILPITACALILLSLSLWWSGPVSSTPANCITHPFVSGKVEQSDASLVGPNEWNACHKVNAPGIGAIPYGDSGQTDGLNWLTAGGTGLPIISQGGGTAPIYQKLAETGGGTNQTTYASGDTLYASATNTLSKRTIGSAGAVNVVSGGLPTWFAPGAAGSVLTTSTGTAAVQWATSQTISLTNKTGVTLSAGDVVEVDTANDSAVTLDDIQWSLGPFVVALESIANNAAGLFALSGPVTVNVTGAITRGDFLRKSTTTKVAEDSGLAMGAPANRRAYGALGVALTASGGGTVTALWFGLTTTVGVMAASINETTTTSVGAVDLLALSNLRINAAAPWSLTFLLRKTAGAAVAPQIGLKINGTQTFNNLAVFTAVSQAETGYATIPSRGLGGMRAANYTQPVDGLIAFTQLAGTALTTYPNQTYAAQFPTGPITSLTITGLSGSASVTLGIANVLLTVGGS